MRPVRGKICPNSRCPDAGRANRGNIHRSGSFRTKAGLRRRYQCKTCGRTMSTNTGTAYSRLQCSRAEFDEVARALRYGSFVVAGRRT